MLGITGNRWRRTATAISRHLSQRRTCASVALKDQCLTFFFSPLLSASFSRTHRDDHFGGNAAKITETGGGGAGETRTPTLFLGSLLFLLPFALASSLSLNSITTVGAAFLPVISLLSIYSSSSSTSSGLFLSVSISLTLSQRTVRLTTTFAYLILLLLSFVSSHLSTSSLHISIALLHTAFYFTADVPDLPLKSIECTRHFYRPYTTAER